MENTVKKTKVMYFTELREMVMDVVTDEEKQDELLAFIDKQIETLEKLIECGWETGEVCRLLYIHRNTLVKRKAKIVDLIKSNMGLDTTAALQLGMFAYKILKYLYKT